VRGFDWRGLAAVLIVVGVFAVLLVGAIGATLNHDREVTTDEITTVSAVLGTAIGAVSVYLGTKARGRPRERPSGRRPPRGPQDHDGPGV
jgi:hypothetical protein